jgi:protein-S-isoprenylcysteine O-methyltransferase Ste14
MGLPEEHARAGGFLFRWRGYLPLLFLIPVLTRLPEFGYPLGEHALDLAWESLCLATGLFGLAIRILTVGCAPEGTSGRGTAAPKASALNTTGMYSVVRNPLYLANFFMYLAPVLFVRDWRAAVIFLLAFVLYYERIIAAEEAFLRREFKGAFERWAASTPCLAPRPSLWKRPECPFRWKKALSLEFHGLFGLVSALFLLETLSDIAALGRPRLDPVWAGLFAGAALFYLAVRLLVKRTSLLEY